MRGRRRSRETSGGIARVAPQDRAAARAVRTALLGYLDERRQALQLLVKGARFNDNSESQRGEAMMKESNDAARQVRELIGQTR